VLKNSTQRNLVQNIGTLSLQIGLQEMMFAKARHRGKKFSEFDRSGSDTEFFNTIGSIQSFAATCTKVCFAVCPLRRHDAQNDTGYLSESGEPEPHAPDDFAA
jgi:hypothetical protein